MTNQVLDFNKVDKELQSRIRKYLKYKFESESNQQEERESLNILSS